MIQMLGYPSREALLAVNAGDLYVNPEDRRRWQALIGREPVLVDFETQYRRQGGAVLRGRDAPPAAAGGEGRGMYSLGLLGGIKDPEQTAEGPPTHRTTA